MVGVDLSPNGIADLTAAAARENLPAHGVVADIVTYRPEGHFDVVLIDRTLHMLGRADRLLVLKTLADHVSEGGGC